jgi:hypothetical protein
VHEVLQDKKRKLSAEAERAVCLQIDSELCAAARYVPMLKTELLVVSESDFRKREPRTRELFWGFECAHGHPFGLPHVAWRTHCTVQGCPKRAWGEELTDALEGATPGCKHSLAGQKRGTCEQQLIVWREGGYWEDVEERLNGTDISVDKYEGIVQAALEAKVRLDRTRIADVCPCAVSCVTSALLPTSRRYFERRRSCSRAGGKQCLRRRRERR